MKISLGPRLFFPGLIFSIILTVFPLLYTIYLSFDLASPGATEYVLSLRHYFLMFSDFRFWNGLINTVKFVIPTITLQLILGFGIANLLNQKLRGKRLAHTIILIPMITTPIVAVLMWKILVDPTLGVYSTLLEMIGIGPFSWLGSPSLAMVTVILVDVWQWTPFMVIVLLAGIQSLPKEPFEAAKLDGASIFAVTRYITLPLLAPLFLILVVLRGTFSILAFDLLYGLTRGGPGYVTETLNLYIYQSAFRFGKMNYASAMSVIFLLIIVVVIGGLLVRYKSILRVD